MHPMMNNVMFESFEVDIQKTGKEDVCFYPRDSIYYQDKISSSPIINVSENIEGRTTRSTLNYM